jgi:predicted amidohydrolase/DNA polymerase III epsilon subunit-like protein
MKNLKIALLQLEAKSENAESLWAGIEACRRARHMGADIALFPEMWSCGYSLPNTNDINSPEAQAWLTRAIEPTGDYVQAFKEEARKLGMAIGLSYLEKTESLPRNSFCLISAQGHIALDYSKVHTCDFSDDRLCRPGDGFRVGVLDTEAGPVSLGAMICFDREFPESARSLMLQGAEIVLVPNACELELNRVSQLRSRAYENMMGIALANYPGPICKGRSMAFDGMAFTLAQGDQDGSSRDMLLVEAGAEEGIFMASFDLEALREYRRREVWGDAYRKPYAYAALLQKKAVEPFTRKDSRREAEAASKPSEKPTAKKRSKASAPELKQDFCAIDFETGNNLSASACAVGLVRVRDGKITDSFYSLIKPPEGMQIFSSFTAIHGITMRDVRDKRDFGELWPTLAAFIGNDTLVAHNASFDRNVLASCIAYYEIDSAAPVFECTVKISRRAWPQLRNHKLNTVCEYLGIELKHHEALSDARGAALIYVAARKALGISYED